MIASTFNGTAAETRTTRAALLVCCAPSRVGCGQSGAIFLPLRGRQTSSAMIACRATCEAGDEHAGVPASAQARAQASEVRENGLSPWGLRALAMTAVSKSYPDSRCLR